NRGTAALAVETPSDRARRHLAALARLGDGLRKQAPDRAALMRLVCEVARDALDADRAMLLAAEAGGRLTTAPAAAGPNDTGGSQVSLAREVVDRVVKRGRALVIEDDTKGPRKGDRVALAAPIALSDAEPGLLYVDRAATTTAPAWGEPDLQL